MNWARGLIRAWIVLSALWKEFRRALGIIGARKPKPKGCCHALA